MIKNICILLLVTVSVLSLLPLQEDLRLAQQNLGKDVLSRRTKDIDLDAIEKFITEARICRTIPGLAVGIVKNGNIIYKKGFGVRNMETQSPVTEHTLFGIGSTTKAMTASLAALLVQQGHLNWDDTVHSHMPDFKTMDSFVSSRATLIDLMTHRTGLSRHDAVWIFRGRYANETESLSRSNLVKGVRYLQPSKDFRVQFQYNNNMFAIAGFTIGEVFRVANKSDCTINNCWETLIQNALFDKIGMTETIPNYLLLLAKNATKPVDFAQGYVCKVYSDFVCKSIDDVTKCPGDDEHNMLLDVTPNAPAGSVLSSVNDMTKWMTALLAPNGDVYLTKESVDKLFTGEMPIKGADSMYGLGWNVERYHNNRYIHHSGQVPGFLTQLSLFPDTKDGYVILMNHNSAYPALLGLTQYMNDVVLGLTPSIDIKTLCDATMPKPPKRPLASIFTSSVSTGIAATYSHPIYGSVKIIEQYNNGKYQYEFLLNDRLRAPVRSAVEGTFVVQVNLTFAADQTFPLSFDRNYMSNKVDRVKIPFEATVAEIVYTNSDFESRGFGAYVGIGGDGFGFPLESDKSSPIWPSNGISVSQWMKTDLITSITLGATALLCILVIVTLIAVIVVGVRARNSYDKLN
jgi:CubicO group peptidase (beta-lactamase class C family)